MRLWGTSGSLSIGHSLNEDMDVKLKIELVPKPLWRKSLAQLLPHEVWISIREDRIRIIGSKCEICASTEKPLELHERWKYDDRKHVQKLAGFWLLCKECHAVKHFGRSSILAREGKLDLKELVKHFCSVNRCSKRDFERHSREVWDIWEKRSKHEWKQDFGKYKQYLV